MKNIFIIIFLIQFLLIGCNADSSEMYKEEISELLQNPNTREFRGKEKDWEDLRSCPVLSSISKWKIRNLGTEEAKNIEYIFSRDYVWIDKNIISEPDIGLDRANNNFSFKIIKNPNYHPVYIGPWHYSSKLQKTIRFFAYQKIDGGPIYYQYESQTEENKNIPEKSFSLSGNISPDKSSLCIVKWIARYGYNAVIDLHKNPWYPIFSKQYLVGTGKIIEAKE